MNCIAHNRMYNFSGKSRVKIPVIPHTTNKSTNMFTMWHDNIDMNSITNQLTTFSTLPITEQQLFDYDRKMSTGAPEGDIWHCIQNDAMRKRKLDKDKKKSKTYNKRKKYRQSKDPIIPVNVDALGKYSKKRTSRRFRKYPKNFRDPVIKIK